MIKLADTLNKSMHSLEALEKLRRLKDKARREGDRDREAVLADIIDKVIHRLQRTKKLGVLSTDEWGEEVACG